MLIDIYVGQLRQAAQCLEYLGRPLVQIADAVALQRVLILRADNARADSQRLNGLKKYAGARHPC